MKKNHLFKILLTFCLSFLLVNRVGAIVGSGICGVNVEMTSSGVSAHFDVKAECCNWVRTGKFSEFLLQGKDAGTVGVYDNRKRAELKDAQTYKNTYHKNASDFWSKNASAQEAWASLVENIGNEMVYSPGGTSGGSDGKIASYSTSAGMEVPRCRDLKSGNQSGNNIGDVDLDRPRIQVNYNMKIYNDRSIEHTAGITTKSTTVCYFYKCNCTTITDKKGKVIGESCERCHTCSHSRSNTGECKKLRGNGTEQVNTNYKYPPYPPDCAGECSKTNTYSGSKAASCTFTCSETVYWSVENTEAKDEGGGQHVYNAKGCENLQEDMKKHGGGTDRQDWHFLCPIYKCQSSYQDVGACSHKFQTQEAPRKDVYCVNPGNTFSTKKYKKGSKNDPEGIFDTNSGNYQIDPTFDFRDCTSSYANDSCGFANILIESEWLKRQGHDIDYATINNALRLWGAHKGASGYHNVTGVSLYSTAPGTDGVCSNLNLFLFVPSVYTVSQSTIMSGMFKAVTDYNKEGYIDAVKFADNVNSYYNVDTRFPQSIGHIFKSGGRNFRKMRISLGLLFNTMLGNSKMMEHGIELFGRGIDRADSVDILPADDETSGDSSIIETNYGPITYSDFKKDIEYDCSNLEKYRSLYGDKFDSFAAYIKPYCLYTKVKYKINGFLQEAKTSICTGKTSLLCRSVKIPYAKCDENQAIQSVTYSYEDGNQKDGGGPVRLVSCENTGNQIMYMVVKGEDVKKGSRTEEIAINNLNCNTGCNSLEIRKKDTECTNDSNDLATAHRKDPSLKCILNAGDNAGKQRYDYSKEFGVNTAVCRVYCSDEVHYYIENAMDAKSGQSFKYDIGLKAHLQKMDNKLFSNVVKEVRNCVSEIYYNTNFSINADWQKLYGLDLKFIQENNNGHNIRNIKELYNLIILKYKKEGMSAGKAVNAEVLNELAYDLYNCNFFNENTFKVNNVTTPKNRFMKVSEDGNEKDGNIYKNYILNEFSVDNDYGLHGTKMENITDCDLESNGSGTCAKMDSIYYEAGANTTAGKVGGKNQDDSKIELSSVISSELSPVKYCYDDRGDKSKGAFYYDPSWKPNTTDDENSYNYSNNCYNSGRWETIGGKKLPTNDYAMFTVNTEIGFYNHSKYKTEREIGHVEDVTEVPNESNIDSYSFPISQDAYTLCTTTDKNNTGVSDDKSNSKTRHQCAIEHAYEKLNTYYRVNFDDGFYDSVNSYKPKCYYNAEKRSSSCPNGTKGCKTSLFDVAEYRAVDRSNMFPNGNLGYTYTNWNSNAGVSIQKEIETANDDIYLDDKYLQYSFTLTPEQIKNIRAYNRTAESYAEVVVDNCQSTDGRIFENCRVKEGSVLDTIRENQDASNTGYGSVNNNKDGSKLFDNSEDYEDED